MVDSIYQRQNCHEILSLQKAQRSNYAKAKVFLYWGIFLSIVGTVFFIILTSFYNTELLNTLSSFMAIVIFAIMICLEKKSMKDVLLAAKIQQTIDVRLFQLPDNCQVLLQSEINELIASIIPGELSEYENWYSDYSSLDFQKQILLSQKENIRWDKTLREKYCVLLQSFAVGVPILLLFYAIFASFSLSSIFAIASWLFPIEKFLITQWVGLRDDIRYLETVKTEFHNVEKLIENDCIPDIYCKLCVFQTFIFEHRIKSVLIPEWFYNKHKKWMQKIEDSIANETIVNA